MVLQASSLGRDLQGSITATSRNLYAEDELPARGALAKRDPEEDPEAAGGNHVGRGAGADDEGGDPLRDAIAAAGEGHEGGDDDGGGDSCRMG